MIIKRIFLASFALLPGLLPAGLLAAEDDSRWALCRPSAELVPLLELGPLSDPATRITADEGSADNQGVSHFSGDVVVLQSGRRSESDEAHYDQNDDLLKLKGNVWFYTDDMALSGSNASFLPKSNQGELEDASYHFRSLHASGQASRIIIHDTEHIELTHASYTTCDPEKVDWQLKARRVKLDESTNTGEAYNATLEFKGVPFLYTPYLNFPLKGRKTGLLMPNFGSSNQTGTDISLPWYWNIAPNYDATITPRHMSARGTQLQGEFRYLHPTDRGQLNVEILPNDSRYSGQDRHAVSYTHSGGLGAGWSTALLYNEVSDTDYFNHLGNNLTDSSLTHLERRFDLNWRDNGWNFLGRVREYQTIYGSQPYTTLPQLQLSKSSPRQLNSLQYNLHGELVNFTHKDKTKLVGKRLDLSPDISFPLAGAAWFLTPRLNMRHTQYQLDNQEGDASPSRTLPVISIDSGLFFERDLSIGQRPLLQTLEPRLFYLYAPYRDQDDLPNFDTSEYDFTFAQLFRNNHFSGADRQADANQLTLALTSRLIDSDNGTELLYGSLGQIRYFNDRKVNLNKNIIKEEKTSDYVAELGARPVPKLNISLSTRWNPQDSKRELITSRIRYVPDERRLFSLDYRQRQDESLRQADLIVYWPISQRWRLLGRWNYDLEQKRNLETVAGLAWEDCCWALHFVMRSQLNSSSLETNKSFMITLELKGLSSLNKRLEDELQDFQTRQH